VLVDVLVEVDVVVVSDVLVDTEVEVLLEVEVLVEVLLDVLVVCDVDVELLVDVVVVTVVEVEVVVVREVDVVVVTEVDVVDVRVVLVEVDVLVVLDVAGMLRCRSCKYVMRPSLAETERVFGWNPIPSWPRKTQSGISKVCYDGWPTVSRVLNLLCRAQALGTCGALLSPVHRDAGRMPNPRGEAE